MTADVTWFHGPAATGKTREARRIAADMGAPVEIIDFPFQYRGQRRLIDHIRGSRLRVIVTSQLEPPPMFRKAFPRMVVREFVPPEVTA